MSFKDNMDGESWENYCEKMLRYEFGWSNFTSVPHSDRGDHGIEFFTNSGEIFQCYYPDPQYSMKEYRQHVQKKINDDLKKLSKNQHEIQKMLGDIKISRWVLVIPAIRSKELLKYIKKKEEELPNLSFSSINGISIKIETDDSFHNSALYARSSITQEINIAVDDIKDGSAAIWMEENSEFFENICRKTKSIAQKNLEKLRQTLIEKYLQVDALMDAYREQFPDLHSEVMGVAVANLVELQNENLFDQLDPKDAYKSLLQKNRASLTEIEKNISKHNLEVFSSGLIAKWLAECKMDFIVDG